jgi:hypothetical protein
MSTYDKFRQDVIFLVKWGAIAVVSIGVIWIAIGIMLSPH